MLPERPGPHGQGIEVLWDSNAQRVIEGRKLTVKEMATVPTHPDTATNINAHLMGRKKTVEDTFYRLFDNGGPGRLPKAVLAVELAPGKAAPIPVAAPKVRRTFRQVLEEWKGENRNLAKDSLRKYDQLATMMESGQPDLRPDQVTQKVAKEYQQHLLDLQKSDATIKVHFGGIRKCLEQLGQPHDMVWLQYSAKNAPQLDLEIEEVRRLI